LYLFTNDQELAVSILACARIGAIPLFFAGFSASAVASRIIDSECKMVITSDGGYRGNKTIALKKIDEALECTSIERYWLLKEQTLDNDERGQRYGCNPY
jgi:acetyl-CoA synthetase